MQTNKEGFADGEFAGVEHHAGFGVMSSFLQEKFPGELK